MADTTYNVTTVYRVETGQATAGINRLAASKSVLTSVTGKLTGAFDGLVGRVVSLGSSAVAAAGSLGVALLTREVFSLNSAAESATIGIAGMIQAGGGAQDFTSAMSASQAIIAQMRRDASALPGTFEDLQNVFQGGLLPGLMAGRSAEQVEDLSARFMAVGKTLNVQSQIAGRELAMMLEGRAGAHVVMFSRLQPLVGKTAQEFNKLSTAERFELISKALRGFDPAIQAYAHTWDAISSTSRDTLTNFMRTSSAPLFERVKNQLFDINSWLERNQARVDQWSHAVGDKLVGAFDRVKSSIIYIHDHFHEIVTDAQTMAERYGGAALLGRGALGLMSNSGVASAVGGVVGGGALGGSLTIAAAVAPFLVAVADGSVSLRRLKSDVDAVVMPLTEGFRNLYNVVEPMASALGRVQFSALEFLLDRAQQAASAFESLTSVLNSVKESIPATVGLYVETFWDEARREFGRFARASLYAIPGIGQVLGVADAYSAYRDRHGGPRAAGEGYEYGRVEGYAHAVTRVLAEDPRHRRRPETPHRGNMTVNVRLIQTINDAANPDAVVVNTRRAIYSAIYHPVETHGAAVMR